MVGGSGGKRLSVDERSDGGEDVGRLVQALSEQQGDGLSTNDTDPVVDAVDQPALDADVHVGASCY